MSLLIKTVAAVDGYPLQVRTFPATGSATATVLLLHGVVSHSEWLAPIAARLAGSGFNVVCPDRRGAGLSESARGDAPDAATLIADVQCVVSDCCDDSLPLHVGGFCWGATYAINVLLHDRLNTQSLIMIAPSIFPAADVAGAPLVTGESAVADLVPNVPIDRFTDGPDYADFIVPDSRRTHYVSPRFNGILVAMNRLLAPRWAKLDLPALMVLAEHDRLSDSAKHERAFSSLRLTHKQCVTLPGQHGVQFDAPDACAEAVVAWIRQSQKF